MQDQDFPDEIGLGIARRLRERSPSLGIDDLSMAERTDLALLADNAARPVSRDALIECLRPDRRVEIEVTGQR